MRRPAIRRPAILAGLASLAALVAGGCPQEWRRPAKAPFSALWVGEASPELEAAAIGRLREAGVGELFVDAARLEGGRLEPVAGPAVASGSATTLVVVGAWPSAPEPEALAAGLIEPLRRLRFEAEGRGASPVGFHFDLDGVASLADYGEMLAAVRKGLDRAQMLSATLARGRLEDPELPELAKSVDFLVPMVYGQRPDEPEATDAWDFIALGDRLAKLDQVGRPYAVGAITLGTATLRSRGSLGERTTVASLATALNDRRLRLKAGFSLEGANRRVYELTAERPLALGEWKLASGDGVRLIRPAITDLEELHRRLGDLGLKHRLGEVYYRAPRPDEGLSLGVDALVAALDPEPSPAEFELRATIQRRAPGGWWMRFAVVNHTGEATELSMVENNFLEVRLSRGAFSNRVEPGGFYRFDLGRRDRGPFVRELHRPDTLRVFTPLLENGQEVSTGDVLVAAPGGSLELDLFAAFLLPDGRTAETGPLHWRDGKLLLPEPAPGAEPPPPAAGATGSP